MPQIISFLISALGFVFIFGVVVLVHELGHFLAAKMTGVYAPRFSIGFGPGPKKRWGETQYQLGVIPLGGYVRMASREDEATAFLEGGSEEKAALEAQAQETRPKDWDPEAMIPFGPKPVPEHRWFESKTLPQRLMILVAGVTMNAVLTVVVLFGLKAIDGVRPRVIGGVVEIPSTVPLRAQLLPGDTIVSIQGMPINTWDDIERELYFAKGETLSIGTTRHMFTLPAGPPASRTRAELASAIQPHFPAAIVSVDAGRPAERAGLQTNDIVSAINGEPVRSSYDFVEKVSASPGRDLRFSVLRGGSTVDAVVRPESIAVLDSATGVTSYVGRIGISLPQRGSAKEKVSVPEAFSLAVRETGVMSLAIVRTLQGLFDRSVSIRELGGPITIARASGQAAQQGPVPLFELLALLSINLAILNLLPIPVLDGGQIVIVIAESVKGSPFSPMARQIILGTGVALVLLLMLAVSYNDVLRLFGR